MSSRSVSRLLAPLCFLGLLSCARSTRSQPVGPTVQIGTPHPIGSLVPERPLVNQWEPPYGSWTLLPSISAARKSVTAFRVYDPSRLGEAKPYIHPDQHPPQAVIFVLPSTQFGLLWVAESVPDVPIGMQDQAFREAVGHNGEPGIYVTSQIVQVRGGIEA